MHIHLPSDLSDVPNAAVIARLASAWNPLDLSGSLKLVTYCGPHGHMLSFEGYAADSREITWSVVVPDEVLHSSARSRDAARLFRDFIEHVEGCAEWGDVFVPERKRIWSAYRQEEYAI